MYSIELLDEPKPFIKWAGGKRQLLDALLDSSPNEFNHYYEPFVGGAALFFKLWHLGKITQAHLNDSNPDLVNVYLTIQCKVDELIEELRNEKYRNEMNSFYSIRASQPSDSIERAAKFIYLNKTAFNGLYRVNSKGGFNVPFGRYSNPTILNEQNLHAVSKALEDVSISCKDFQEVVRQAAPGDFVYFDPPYHPLNGTSKFTKYTSNDFSLEDQKRLRDTFTQLTNAGVYALLSNSDTETIHKLYSNYHRSEVYANRAINCKADKRGKITELLIKGWYKEDIPSIEQP